MDIKAYLEHEKRSGSENRSEYIAGELRELLPSDDTHFALRMNFSFLLKEHLSRQDNCRIYMGDMKVCVAGAEVLLYPDIFVTCAESDLQQNDYKEYPLLVVEIVNDASGNFDRGRKFSYYRQVQSLQAYILVDATCEAVDCFQRDAEGRWILTSCGSEDSLHIDCLELDCQVFDIYQDIFAD